jgi:hypothetical protein
MLQDDTCGCFYSYHSSPSKSRIGHRPIFVVLVVGKIRCTENIIWIQHSHYTFYSLRIFSSSYPFLMPDMKTVINNRQLQLWRRGREVLECLNQDSQPREWNGGLNKIYMAHCLPNVTPPAYQLLMRISNDVVGWGTML